MRFRIIKIQKLENFNSTITLCCCIHCLLLQTARPLATLSKQVLELSITINNKIMIGHFFYRLALVEVVTVQYQVPLLIVYID